MLIVLPWSKKTQVSVIRIMCHIFRVSVAKALSRPVVRHPCVYCAFCRPKRAVVDNVGVRTRFTTLLACRAYLTKRQSKN